MNRHTETPPFPGPEQSSLADACPNCHPGDHNAVVPYNVTDDGLSLRAEYHHDECGAAWACSWDAAAAGWAPGSRQTAELNYAAWLTADLKCPDCASQVLVTAGSDRYRPYRARVVHSGGCPWYARHLARVPGYYGAVPCSAQVVHRGPYKRRPPGPPAVTERPGQPERELTTMSESDETTTPASDDETQIDGPGTEDTEAEADDEAE